MKDLFTTSIIARRWTNALHAMCDSWGCADSEYPDIRADVATFQSHARYILTNNPEVAERIKAAAKRQLRGARIEYYYDGTPMPGMYIPIGWDVEVVRTVVKDIDLMLAES